MGVRLEILFVINEHHPTGPHFLFPASPHSRDLRIPPRRATYFAPILPTKIARVEYGGDAWKAELVLHLYEVPDKPHQLFYFSVMGLPGYPCESVDTLLASSKIRALFDIPYRTLDLKPLRIISKLLFRRFRTCGRNDVWMPFLNRVYDPLTLSPAREGVAEHRTDYRAYGLEVEAPIKPRREICQDRVCEISCLDDVQRRDYKPNVDLEARLRSVLNQVRPQPSATGG